jgi:hypothetical protein
MNNSHENDMEKGGRSETSEHGPRTADPVSYARRPSRIANPGPAYVAHPTPIHRPFQYLIMMLIIYERSGLFAFASTTFLLSMYNVNTRGIHTPNIIVGMAIFAGGLVQLLAGMWEFPRGNVFGATGMFLLQFSDATYTKMIIPSVLNVRRILDVLRYDFHPRYWRPECLCRRRGTPQRPRNVPHGLVHGHSDVHVCLLPNESTSSRVFPDVFLFSPQSASYATKPRLYDPPVYVGNCASSPCDCRIQWDANVRHHS